MNETLFEEIQPTSLVKRLRKSNGPVITAGRYSRLKKALDDDHINNMTWYEVETTNIPYDNEDWFFVDFFSGAGGISVGATNAGLKKIASLEIDKDASNTIRNNFPNSLHFEMPIEKVGVSELQRILDKQRPNVIFGGPPCQGFSVAGLRNPKDPRNKLFQEYVRVVKFLNPEFVVMENVPGILTMENGRVFKEIIRQFKDAGYPDMSVRILEAASFGVPQLRARAIFIANRLGLKNPYPKSIYSKDNYIPIESAIQDLQGLPRGAVPNHEWTKHSKEFEERIANVAHGDSLYETFRDAFKRQYKGVPSMTVKENHGGCHIHYSLNRVLSAREMARLQTFPDTFVFSGTFKRAYWQIGNAVPCKMAEHIALAIKDSLQKHTLSI